MKNIIHIIYNDNVKCLINVLNLWHRQDYLDRALQLAARLGYARMVRVLLDDKRAQPIAQEYETLTTKLRANTDENFAMQLASSKGYVQIVNMLLQDGRSAPESNDFKALRLAIKGKYVAVVASFNQYFNLHRIDYRSKLGTEMVRMLDAILVVGGDYKSEHVEEPSTYSLF